MVVGDMAQMAATTVLLAHKSQRMAEMARMRVILGIPLVLFRRIGECDAECIEGLEQ